MIKKSLIGTLGALALLASSAQAASKEEVSDLIRILKSTSNPVHFRSKDDKKGEYVNGTKYSMQIGDLVTEARKYDKVNITLMEYENNPDILKVVGVKETKGIIFFQYVSDEEKKDKEIDGNADFGSKRVYSEWEMLEIAKELIQDNSENITQLSEEKKEADYSDKCLYDGAIRKAIMINEQKQKSPPYKR